MTSGRNLQFYISAIIYIGENQDVQLFVGWQAWIENHMFVVQPNPADEKNGCNQKSKCHIENRIALYFLLYNQAKRLCSQRMHTLQT